MNKVRGPVVWSDEERRRIFEAAAGLTGSYPRRKSRRGAHVLKSAWWTAWLRVATDTALSGRYMMRVRFCDLTGAGVLTVRLIDPARIAAFQLSEDARHAIDAIAWGREDQRSRVFQVGCSADVLRADWRRIRRLAGFRDRDMVGGRRVHANQTRGWDHPDIADLPPVGDISADSRMPIMEFYRRFYLLLKLQGRAERTQTLYEHSIRSFGRFLGREPLLCDFTDELVTRYLAWVAARKRSPYTVEKERCQLLAIWRFACARHLVRDLPTIRKSRLPERAPLAWRVEELQRLFATVEELTGTVGRTPKADWWRALLLVLYDTGERINAVMQLGWEHFDLADGWMHVPAEFRKGKTRDMVFRLHPETVESLKAIQAPRERVFQWPSSQTTIWHALGVILKKAGLPADSRSKFHRIRRTTASLFEASGGDATELLDHSSRTVTRRYLDQRIVQRKHPSELLPRPDGKQGGKDA